MEAQSNLRCLTVSFWNLSGPITEMELDEKASLDACRS